jgi:hypothetical protein
LKRSGSLLLTLKAAVSFLQILATKIAHMARNIPPSNCYRYDNAKILWGAKHGGKKVQVSKKTPLRIYPSVLTAKAGGMRGGA